jgi:fructose-bisphosphate aldolase class II
MPLASIGPALKRALNGHYAIPLFDVFDTHSIEGVFAAAAEKCAPVIFAMPSRILDDADTPALAAYIRRRAETVQTPVSLMLDHGRSFEHCVKAISFGFTDVMFDGSKLSFEENLETTKAVVRAAHGVGALAEAELGHVGHGSQYQEFGAQRKGFTDPALAERFVAETGADLLAVAIGNAHGLYDGAPHLDLDLLRDIRQRVHVPLVLHGGTGLSEEQFRAGIANGVAKINIATDLYVSTTKRLGAALQSEKTTYFDLMPLARDSFRQRCCYYFDLFGASAHE